MVNDILRVIVACAWIAVSASMIPALLRVWSNKGQPGDTVKVTYLFTSLLFVVYMVRQLASIENAVFYLFANLISLVVAVFIMIVARYAK